MWHSITLLLLASLYLLQFGAAGTVPSIVANPAKLAGAGTWVEISWSGMKPELNATNDVLAIYADVQANVNDLPPNHDPLYYVVVSQCAQGLLHVDRKQNTAATVMPTCRAAAYASVGDAGELLL